MIYNKSQLSMLSNESKELLINITQIVMFGAEQKDIELILGKTDVKLLELKNRLNDHDVTEQINAEFGVFQTAKNELLKHSNFSFNEILGETSNLMHDFSIESS